MVDDTEVFVGIDKKSMKKVSLHTVSRLINFGASVLQSNITPRPFKLTFACTYRCNSRCQLCSIWQKPVKPELSLAEIEKFFQRNNYFTWIDVTGGEITLRQDITDIISVIFNNSPQLYFFHFATNCLQPKLVKKVAAHTMQHRPPKFTITLSLDGDEALHDQLRGIQGNWQRVMETYALLQPLMKDGLEAVFGVTVSAANVNHLPAIVAAAKQRFPHLGWKDFHFNIAHHSSHYYGNAAHVASTTEVAQKTIDALRTFDAERPHFWWLAPQQWLDAQYRSYAADYYRTNKSPLPCKSLQSSIFMDAYGNCYPCAMWAKKLFKIQEVDYSLAEFWHSTKAELVRAEIAAKKCSNCWTPCEAYQTILGNIPKVLFHQTG